MLRFLWFFLCLLLIGCFPRTPAYSQQKVNAPGAQGTTLTVNIVGLRNMKGLLHISLFNGNRDGKGFPGSDEDAFQVRVVPAASAVSPLGNKGSVYKASVTFSNLPPGIYAVAMYHDENSNHKMDTYWYGKPKEGGTTSNNPRPFLRAPHFKEAVFSLRADMTITLNLWYP